MPRVHVEAGGSAGDQGCLSGFLIALGDDQQVGAQPLHAYFQAAVDAADQQGRGKEGTGSQPDDSDGDEAPKGLTSAGFERPDRGARVVSLGLLRLPGSETKVVHNTVIQNTLCHLSEVKPVIYRVHISRCGKAGCAG